MGQAVIKTLAVSAMQTRAFERVLSWQERTNTRADLLRILTYHRVDYPERLPYLSPALNSATPEGFESQMRLLAEHYCVVSAQQVLDYFTNGTPLPERAAMVTFDDAYADFAEYAWPILKRYNLPVTLFVPTAFPDQPERVFWWDRIYAALSQTPLEHIDTPQVARVRISQPGERKRTFKQLREYAKSLPHDDMLRWVDTFCEALGAPFPAPNPVLGWDALRRLASDGVSLGAHTRTHPLLNRITPDAARDEILGSLHDLQQQVGDAIKMLAYPAGGLDDRVVNVLRDEGFELAFTTERGINNLRTSDRLRLKRLNVGRLAPDAMVRVQLLGWTL